MLDDLLLVGPIFEYRFAIADPVLADRIRLRNPGALGGCAGLLSRLRRLLLKSIDFGNFDAALVGLLVRQLSFVFVERNVLAWPERVVVLPSLERALKSVDVSARLLPGVENRIQRRLLQ